MTTELALAVMESEESQETHTPSLVAEYERQVRPFIDLIDNLRHFGLEKDIALPSIVVVGDQSAGKSSVLEAISGIQLPRGSGIVTRCPLELRLKSCPPGTVWKATIKYTNENEQIENRIGDPKEIGGEVRRAQKELAGDKNISNELISLEVEAENIPDLTLIDLPGITRVAADGQRSNVPQQIKTMIKEYIQKEATIILAVIPANVDIATIEALQMAKEVDPRGERTVGVVTKPDLVDQGSEAEVVAVVKNKSHMLKKGYTIVKCRGQQAVKDCQTLADAMDEETEFFRNHEHFGQLDGSLYGIKNLAKRLTTELVNHIKKSLPQLKADVRDKQEKVRTELTQLGDGLPETEEGKIDRMMQVLHVYADRVQNAVDGERVQLEDGPGLCNQVRSVYKKLAEDLQDITPRDISVQQKMGEEGPVLTDPSPTPVIQGSETSRVLKYKNELEAGIIQHRGRELPRFMKYSVCEAFIKKLVSQFHGPVHVCLGDVNQIISNLLARLAEHHLCNYPALESKVKELVDERRRDAHTRCEMEIDRLLKMEQNVFTQDSSYRVMLENVLEQREQEKEAKHAIAATAVSGFSFGAPQSKVGRAGATAAMPMTSKPHIHRLSESELGRKDAESTYDMLLAYMQVAERRMADNVPMNINYYLLGELVDNIRLQIMRLTRQEGAANLLEEQWDITEKRKALKDKLQRLNKAARELAKF